MVFFLIFNMVLGLIDQLQIFSQLHLIELLGLFTRAVVLDVSKAFDRVWYAGLKSYGISGQIFGKNLGKSYYVISECS